MALLLSVSCTNIREIDYAKFAIEPKASDVFDEFSETRGVGHALCQAVSLEYRGGTMTGIGLCSYDPARGYIALSLISATGVKILEFMELNRERRHVFAMPELASGDAAPDRIADDARRMYFHPGGKPCFFSSTSRMVRLVFDEGETRTELCFGLDPGAGEKAVLREKKIYSGGSLEGLVFYLDYRDYEGVLYPERIRYENFRYGYVLNLRNIEVVRGAQQAEK